MGQERGMLPYFAGLLHWHPGNLPGDRGAHAFPGSCGACASRYSGVQDFRDKTV